MQNNSHTEFILTPISNLLEDIVSANAGIGDGIETYPLCDYIMQAVFLKMTGFQEQKMKCICWELATYDYEYRYDRFTKNSLGECSSYSDKKDVYKDLIKQIKKIDSSFDVMSFFDRDAMLFEITKRIQDIFLNSNLVSWSQFNFVEFVSGSIQINSADFATNRDLFNSSLQEKYQLLYNHRNRCAHNIHSYQQNLPTLKMLVEENHRFDNYFYRFCLLILIDEIVSRLFTKYKIAIGSEI